MVGGDERFRGGWAGACVRARVALLLLLLVLLASVTGALCACWGRSKRRMLGLHPGAARMGLRR